MQPDANLIDGQRVDAKTIDVLAALANAAPRPLPPPDLMNTVWPNAVVGDNVVHQAMTNIRRALGDNAKKPSYIETVPRRGYRLIADIQWADDPVVVAEPRTRRSRSLAYAMVAVVALAASSLLGAAFVGLPAGHAAPTDLKLTVVPFQHIGADDGGQHASRSIYDEILAAMHRTDAITIVGSQASLAQLSEATGPTLRRRWGTTHLLEGSTRSIEGGRIRVNLRLLDAKRETHVWSGAYEFDAAEDFQAALVRRAGNEIVQAMLGQATSDIAAFEPFTRSW